VKLETSQEFSARDTEMQRSLSTSVGLSLCVADVLAQQRGMLIAVELGVVEDRNTEAVHEFRVAIRRARSLLKVLPDLAGIEPSNRLRDDFTWIARVAGLQRDFDVLLAEIDRRSRRLEFDETTRESMARRLHASRNVAHQRLLRALASARYKRLKTDWSMLIDQLRNQPHGDRAFTDAVAKVVRCDFDALCRHARKLRQKGARRQLHELRKECKQLRYVIESFAHLWPRESLANVIEYLRNLQDDLGKYCDLQTQKALLSELSEFKNKAMSDGIRTWLRDVNRRLGRSRDKSINRCHRFGRKRQCRVGSSTFKLAAAA
jgi:CHAD domain-containing protein